MQTITISPGAVARALVVAAAAVHLLNAVAVWLTVTRAEGQLADESMRLFTIARDGGLATWFTATALLLAAGLLWLAGQVAPRPGAGSRRTWRILAIAAAVLSVDVLAGIHERVGGRIDDLAAAGGVGRLGWLAVLVVALAAGAALLRPFLAAVPPRTGRFLVASAILAGGAGVIGEIEAFRSSGDPEFPATHTLLLASWQKALEMAGAIVLVVGLVDHLGRAPGGTLLRAVREDPRPDGPR